MKVKFSWDSSRLKVKLIYLKQALQKIKLMYIFRFIACMFLISDDGDTFFAKTVKLVDKGTHGYCNFISRHWGPLAARYEH